MQSLLATARAENGRGDRLQRKVFAVLRLRTFGARALRYSKFSMAVFEFYRDAVVKAQQQ